LAALLPAVNTPEFELDGRELLWRRESGSRLQLHDRSRILAESPAQLSHPRPQVGGFGMTERQRRREVIDGFAVGEHGLGAISRLAIRLGGLDRSARGPLMGCDQRIARHVIPTGAIEIESEGIGDTAMQQSATSQAGRLQRRVEQAPMAEVVADAAHRQRTDLADDAAPHQLLDRIDRLLVGSTAGVTQRLELEGTADDGRRGQDLGGRLPDRCDPFAQQLLNASREVAADWLVGR